MQSPISLSDAIGQFNAWRASPGHQRKTPNHLQKLAVSLLPFYPIGKIVSGLKVNHATLKRWKNRHLEPSNTSANLFVSLPTEPAVVSTPSAGPLIIKYPNGVELTLDSPLPIEQMISLITIYSPTSEEAL